MKNSSLPLRLISLFHFLSANRQYNQNLQLKFYKATLLPYETKPEKILALLYNTANTQSQPDIDKLGTFFMALHQHKACVSTMCDFIKHFDQTKPLSFRSLFEVLENQDGWGPKTAALFVKNIYWLHNKGYGSIFKIWPDVPKKVSKDDELYLPVDAVITAIFKQMHPNRTWNFTSINSFVKEHYKRDDIEVWDDLWFWGFFNQKVVKKKRVFEWNENKYWAMKQTDKDAVIIGEIKKKAEVFLELVQ
ncbi:MAG: hypothetical protein U0V54_00255 [Saprospiraceae bacterium]